MRRCGFVSWLAVPFSVPSARSASESSASIFQLGASLGGSNIIKTDDSGSNAQTFITGAAKGMFFDSASEKLYYVGPSKKIFHGTLNKLAGIGVMRVDGVSRICWLETLTDSTGKYTFNDLAAGSYLINFDSDKFDLMFAGISANAGETVEPLLASSKVINSSCKQKDKAKGGKGHQSAADLRPAQSVGL